MTVMRNISDLYCTTSASAAAKDSECHRYV